jgi:hypothetical protein
MEIHWPVVIISSNHVLPLQHNLSIVAIARLNLTCLPCHLYSLLLRFRTQQSSSTTHRSPLPWWCHLWHCQTPWMTACRWVLLTPKPGGQHQPATVNGTDVTGSWVHDACSSACQ